MPVGKTIAECLQALGALERQSGAQTKTQWPQNAKSLNEAIVEFRISIEEESHAHGTGETLNKWVEERAAEWVQSNGERWSAKDRSMLLPHAPVFPRDKSIIVYWIQQYVLGKWDSAIRNRKQKEASRSLPGLDSHGSTTAQFLNNDGRVASTRDIEQAQASEASSESHDLDGWDPYQDSDPNALSPDSAAASVSNPSPIVLQSISNAIVPYRSPDPQASQANDPSQNNSSSIPAANDFRSRTYALVTFQAEMYSRITFLVGPSKTRDGYTSNFYARIMGLEEAQKAETFRAGVLERLGEMGEVVGSRRLVAKPEGLAIPFVVENDHDHHYLLEAVKTWAEWKVPSLCVVYVSLEHEI